MTDIEFATCDLEHIDEIHPQKYKKFYELEYNEYVYAVRVEIKGIYAYYNKYKFPMKSIERPHGTNPNNTKARLCNIYFDEPKPGLQRRGIQVDKNRSSVVKFKELRKDDTYVVIYGTTLQECIERTEKILNMPVENKLEWGGI